MLRENAWKKYDSEKLQKMNSFVITTKTLSANARQKENVLHLQWKKSKKQDMLI